MTDTHIPPPGRRLSARSSRVALQLGSVLCLFVIVVGSLQILGSRSEVHAGSKGGQSGGTNGGTGDDGSVVVAAKEKNKEKEKSDDSGNGKEKSDDSGNGKEKGDAGGSKNDTENDAKGKSAESREKTKKATVDSDGRKQGKNVTVDGREEGKVVPAGAVDTLIDKVLDEGAIPTEEIDTLTEELLDEEVLEEQPTEESESEEPIVEETVPVEPEEIPLPNDPEPSASFPTHPTFRIDRSKTADISGEEFKDRLRLTLTRRDGAVSHPQFDLTDDGRHSVLTLDGSAFRPGRFTLTAVLLPHASVLSRTGRTAARTDQGGTRVQGGEELTVLEETFLWGVVGFNTDREVYAVGDFATLSFSVLDDLGQPTCAPSLTLQVIGPVKNVRTYAVPDSGTEAEVIEVPAYCDPTTSPDARPPVYRLTIPLGLVGTYAFTLDAETAAGQRQHADYVTVVETSPFLDIRRDALTLITGPETEAGDLGARTQNMRITVVPRYTFVGTLTETIPEGWDVSAVTPEGLPAEAPAGAQVGFSQPTRSSLAWHGRFEAGVPTVLTYTATRTPVIDATGTAYSEFVQFGPLTADGIIDNLFEPLVDPVIPVAPAAEPSPVEQVPVEVPLLQSGAVELPPADAPPPEPPVIETPAVEPLSIPSSPVEAPLPGPKPERVKITPQRKLEEKPRSQRREKQDNGDAGSSEKSSGKGDTPAKEPIKDAEPKGSLEGSLPTLLADVQTTALVQQRADERARVRALRRGETPLVRKPWLTTTVVIDTSVATDGVIVHRELVASEQPLRSDSGPSDAQFRSVEPRQWNTIVVGEPSAPVAETGSSALLILEPISETADYALTDSPAFVVVTPEGTDDTEKKALKEKLEEDRHDKKLDPIDHAEGRKHLLEALTSEEVTPADAEREDLITVSLISDEGKTPVDFSFEQASGTTVIVIEPDRTMTPGTYTLELTVKDPDTGQITTLTQNFTWGVLALNFDADRYLPGSRAAVAIGVLDDHGEIVCDAQVTLTVTSPSGAEQIRTTADGTIAVTGTCGIKDSMLTTPDYEARLTFEEEGEYTAVLEATTPSGTHSITATVPVTADPPLIIRRTAATRLYPVGTSPMEVEVRFLSSYSGTIEDTVPEGFAISDVSESGTVASAGDGTTITWSGTWSQGETVTFTYLYDAPDISPEFYLVGPLTFSDGSVELRSWQIANDAPPTDSLVGYWKFDETSGTVAADSSGDGNTGTHTNSPTISTDVPGTTFTNARSLNFDGSDDYVRASINASTVLSGDFTISTWFRVSSLTGHQMLICFGDEETGERRCMWKIDGSNLFSFNGYNADISLTFRRS